jgi:hypothetical protein
MYALQTIPMNHPSGDAKLKYEATHRKADETIVGRPPREPSQKRRHEAISAVENRTKPWMKHLTLSSKDLIWGSCSSMEEEFMDVSTNHKSSSTSSPPVSPTSRSESHHHPEDPLAEMTAALSSLPGNHTKMAISAGNNLSLESDQHSFPRFRQDLIMDHDDVELKMQELQASLLRSTSSDSLPLMALEESSLSYSTSFVATQREIMSQIMRDSTSSFCCFEPRGGGDGGPGPTSRAATTNDTGGGSRVAPLRSMESKHSSLSSSTTREETLDGTGSKVRIHGEGRVFAAMDQGTASLLQCLGCSRHMMATNDMKLVYCPGCGTLTPFEMGLVPSNIRRTVAESPK